MKFSRTPRGLLRAAMMAVGLLAVSVVAPTPVHAATTVAQRVVAIATDELGTSEWGNNCNPYGPCEPWCADFVKWVWNKAGADTSGRTAASSSFLDHGRTSGYTPKIGDAIVFDWNGDRVKDHVGIIVNLDSSNYYTIEGNTSTNNVARRSHPRSDPDIVGWGELKSDGVVHDKTGPALVRSDGDGTMSIYRWSSSGSAFGSYVTYNSGPFSLSAVGDRVASGDVDGDGDDDVVMAYQNADGTFSFYVFKNGHVSAGKWYTSGPFNLDNVAGRLVVADFTGDGKAEPALVYDAGTTMRIYRWTSTGSGFGGVDTYDSGTFDLSKVGDRVAAGDVDGNGKADIVMAYQLADGTFSYYVFKGALTSAGRWYTSGPFTLGPTAGRLVLGAW